MCLSLHFPEKTRNAFVFCLESTVKQKDASVFFKFKARGENTHLCFFGQFCFGSKDTLTVAIFCGCASKRFAYRFSLLGFLVQWPKPNQLVCKTLQLKWTRQLQKPQVHLFLTTSRWTSYKPTSLHTTEKNKH